MLTNRSQDNRFSNKNCYSSLRVAVHLLGFNREAKTQSLASTQITLCDPRSSASWPLNLAFLGVSPSNAISRVLEPRRRETTHLLEQSALTSSRSLTVIRRERMRTKGWYFSCHRTAASLQPQKSRQGKTVHRLLFGRLSHKARWLVGTRCHLKKKDRKSETT